MGEAGLSLPTPHAGGSFHELGWHISLEITLRCGSPVVPHTYSTWLSYCYIMNNHDRPCDH